MADTVTKRRLDDLLPERGLVSDLMVTGISADSRRVERGDLFLAVPGPVTDGRRFIDDAISAGAAAVLFEEGEGYTRSDRPVPQLPVPGLSHLVGGIASRFFGHPSESLRVIAVTGTNGKTSCTHFIASALCELGEECAIIGTLGFGRANAPSDFGLTTPGAVEMQRILHQLRAEGFRSVAVEASSHGLAQGRLEGTAVDVAVFTNLTRDHLDYHQDFEGYKAAKRILFELPGISLAVLNLDDRFGRELASALVGVVPRVLTYSLTTGDADLHCGEIAPTSEGLSAAVTTPWGTGTLTSRLFGRFYLSNLLAVIAVLGSGGFALDRILSVVGGLQTVRGRMDRIAITDHADVVIDYAHTPDALEQSLKSVREHCRGRLWCVFGCGGDRDTGKRPLMGEIAERYADRVVLTDDNPRGEDSRAIVDDILKGLREPERALVEIDRAAAVRYAIEHAAPGDVVLLAGKGHENYQDKGGERREYSDYDAVHRVAAALNDAGSRET